MHPLILLLLGFPGSEAPHPDSLSRSRLVVLGDSARLELRFQSLSLLELRPALDLDRDGQLSDSECLAGEDWILGYVATHWRLLASDPRAAGADEPLAQLSLLRIGEAPRAADAGAAGGPQAGQIGLGWLEAHFVFQAAEPLRSFRIESSLFVEENPAHRDMASVVFHDEAEFFLPFQAGPFRYDFEPAGRRRPGVLASYFALGYRHIQGGYDHLAFLLVLIVAVPRLRSLLGLVTAFTVAHSITLSASVLDAGGWFAALDAGMVEMGIALSIAYVATDNLIRQAARCAWIEAFLFGLLHGLGFAGYLREALGGEPMVVSALLAFNLGVEGGQLLVVLAAALCLGVLHRVGKRRSIGKAAGATREGRPASFAPPLLRNLVSAAVALLGFYWFFERTGWFS